MHSYITLAVTKILEQKRSEKQTINKVKKKNNTYIDYLTLLLNKSDWCMKMELGAVLNNNIHAIGLCVPWFHKINKTGK